MVKKGLLITFEGLEGAGKGTHLKLIKRYLKKEGIPVSDEVFYEPGGTPFGDTMRVFLKRKADTPYGRMHLSNIVPLTEKFSNNSIVQSLLFFAARSDQLEKKVASELERGNWVLLDRSRDSTTIYQGYGSDLPYRRLFDISGAIKEHQNFSSYNHSMLGSFIDTIVNKELNNDSSGHLNDFLTEINRFDISLFTKTLLYLAVQQESYDGIEHLVDPSQRRRNIQSFISWIREANDLIFENSGVEIAKTIYLDVDARVGLERAQERELIENPNGSKKDYFESKGLEYFELLRKGYFSEVEFYKKLPENHPQHNRIVTINTERAPWDVTRDIRANVLTHLIEKYRNQDNK